MIIHVFTIKKKRSVNQCTCQILDKSVKEETTEEIVQAVLDGIIDQVAGGMMVSWWFSEFVLSLEFKSSFLMSWLVISR